MSATIPDSSRRDFLHQLTAAAAGTQFFGVVTQGAQGGPRRQGPEPSQAIEHGRPTKRDRRQLSDWNRWSASVDD